MGERNDGLLVSWRCIDCVLHCSSMPWLLPSLFCNYLNEVLQLLYKERKFRSGFLGEWATRRPCAHPRNVDISDHVTTWHIFREVPTYGPAPRGRTGATVCQPRHFYGKPPSVSAVLARSDDSAMEWFLQQLAASGALTKPCAAVRTASKLCLCWIPRALAVEKRAIRKPHAYVNVNVNVNGL